MNISAGALHFDGRAGDATASLAAMVAALSGLAAGSRPRLGEAPTVRGVAAPPVCPGWCAGDHHALDAHYAFGSVVEVAGDRPVELQIEQEPDGAPLLVLGVTDFIEVRMTWAQAHALRHALAAGMDVLTGTTTAVTR